MRPRAPTFTDSGFIKAAETFPKDFFRKGGLRNVCVVREFEGNYGGTKAACASYSLKTIWIPQGREIMRSTIAHEMYHVIDRRDIIDIEWGKLNHPDYILRQIAAYRKNVPILKERYDRYLRKMYTWAIRQKKNGMDPVGRDFDKNDVKQILLNDPIEAGFVSDYAMTSQLEDRADTFMYMYIEQELFLSRVKDNPVLKKKMEFVREETKEWLGRHYWSMVDEYGTDPKLLILSSPPTNSLSNVIWSRVTISRTILDEDSLVQYKKYKGLIQPGKPIEKIMKRLRSDLEVALKHAESKTFAARKKEAFYIAKSVKKYKETLVSLSNEMKMRGDIEGVKKAVRLLVGMYPSRKEEWFEKFGIDFE